MEQIDVLKLNSSLATSAVIREKKHSTHVIYTSEEHGTGRWIILTECANAGIYCSECHKKIFKKDFSNTMKWKDFQFCPNCGAKMEGET